MRLTGNFYINDDLGIVYIYTLLIYTTGHSYFLEHFLRLTGTFYISENLSILECT